VGEDLSDLGELEVIRRLLARVPTGELIVPPGDDAALVPMTSETLATADLLVEGRHFDFAFSSPGDVGFKALTVNVSDIAAMGGRPRYATVSVGAPAATGVAVLEALYDGIGEAARAYGVTIAGGDTVGADAIIVLECDVPWIPSLEAPRPECRVIHLGVDPLFSRYPIRGFPCDLAVTGAAATALPELAAGLDRRVSRSAVSQRQHRLAEEREALVAGWQKTRESVAGMRPIHMAWASACIARVKPEDAILVNEYTLMPEHCGSNLPGSYFGSSTGGGAALVAAAELQNEVGAVVSRGGRPDLAGAALPQVKAPTLLIVGGDDTPVIAMNREAYDRMTTLRKMEIIPGASHLFEEPGTLEKVAKLAGDWFKKYLR